MKRLAFTALTLHAFALGAWVFMMPWGFPSSHPHFWANEALPLLALAALIAGGIGIVRSSDAAARAVLGGLGGAWLGASVSSMLVFRISAGWPALACAAVALVPIVVWRSRWSLLAALLATAGGAAVPICERAGDADTRPLNEAAPPGTPQGIAVQVSCGRLTLRVDPMLRFQSTSPDRCWTLFTAFTPMPEQPDLHGALTIERTEGETKLGAYSTLSREVYSHLNHFTELQISGHSDLRISFSAAPQLVMPIEPVDYPIGRPSRFAYLGSDDQLHVVEASSAEKGPFHELASGPLPGGVLELTLYDGTEPQCRIALETWAAQAGRALSPTAGWGVPVNAIELMRAAEPKTSPAALFVSLAATSVGRGWDSVGHRAGTYVNRMTIRATPRP